MEPFEVDAMERFSDQQRMYCTRFVLAFQNFIFKLLHKVSACLLSSAARMQQHKKQKHREKCKFAHKQHMKQCNAEITITKSKPIFKKKKHERIIERSMQIEEKSIY